MKTSLKFLTLLVALTMGMFVTPAARAECGYYSQAHKGAASLLPQSWQGMGIGEASFVLASDHESDESIVGFWKVAFTAKGNTEIPDGTPIDSALVVWHSDGTEIMNSGRPPQDGNFCMGVWKKVGKSKYKLNHFALGNDPNGNPTGPTHLVEHISVSHDGNSYAGTFTIDAYDTSGNLAAHIIGIIAATRITVHTPSVL